MTLIQVDLSEKEDQKVEIFKALNGLSDKKTAIKQIIQELKINTGR